MTTRRDSDVAGLAAHPGAPEHSNKLLQKQSTRPQVPPRVKLRLSLRL